MRQKILLLAIVIAAAAFAQGCATITHGSTQQITIDSNPIGATVLIDGGMRFTTPTVVPLSRKDPHTIVISLEGFATETVDVRSVTSDAVYGNILFGGLIGYAIDSSNGASKRLDPEVIKLDLRPLPKEPEKAPPPTAVEQSTNPIQPVSQ
jgi:PEGA domain-containing protein